MKQILTEQSLRMQKLAGILTESEYKEKLDELSPETIKQAYDKSKATGQTGRKNIMTKGAEIYKAEEAEKRKAAWLKQEQEAQKIIKDAGLEEFIGKSMTTYKKYSVEYGNLTVEKDVRQICDDCIYLNNNSHFAINNASIFIYNYNKNENSGDDNFIIDGDVFGIDRTTANLLVNFAKKINPSSKLTSQNIKVKDHDEPLPVLGIHFSEETGYGDELSITIQE